MSIVGYAFNNWLQRWQNVSVMRQDIPTIRDDIAPKERVPVLFEYIGGKTYMADDILSDIGCVTGNLIDPFFGSGSMPLRLKQTSNLGGNIVAQEQYSDIVNVWKMASERGDELLSAIGKLYNNVGGVMTEEYGLELREKYNTGIQDNIDRAAYWIVLSRAARFKNLQVNCKGKITGGMQRRGNAGSWTDAYKSKLKSAIDLAKYVNIEQSRDFIGAIESAKSDDVVYLDPPYISRKFKYPGECEWGKWTEENLDTLINVAKDAASRGVRIVVSESITEAPKFRDAGFSVREIKHKIGQLERIPSEIVATIGPNVKTSPCF